MLADGLVIPNMSQYQYGSLTLIVVPPTHTHKTKKFRKLMEIAYYDASQVMLGETPGPRRSQSCRAAHA